MIIAVVLLINSNSSRGTMRASTSLGSARTQGAVSSMGYSNLAAGGRLTTAAAQQGSSQCVSTYKVPPDTPTAQCQAFCKVNFKKFHCMWCKCRACEFCPKGAEAIEEAAKDSSPPPPPDASFVFQNLEPVPPSPPPSNGTGLSGENTTVLSTNATGEELSNVGSEQLLVTPASEASAAAAETGGLALSSSNATNSMLLQTETEGVAGIKDPVLAAAAAAVDAQPTLTTVTTPSAADAAPGAKRTPSAADAAPGAKQTESERDAAAATAVAATEADTISRADATLGASGAALAASATEATAAVAEAGAQAQPAADEEYDQELRDPVAVAEVGDAATA